eukprot:Skav214223  [mRNA]  locus=scaffold856:39051:46271:+ [translate_table: standard]
MTMLDASLASAWEAENSGHCVHVLMALRFQPEYSCCSPLQLTLGRQSRHGYIAQRSLQSPVRRGQVSPLAGNCLAALGIGLKCVRGKASRKGKGKDGKDGKREDGEDGEDGESLSIGEIGKESGEDLRPLIFQVTVLKVTEHKKSSGRFEVVTVVDPEFADCNLTVVVRAGEFKAGELAFLLPVGTKVPETLARRCGWEGLLAESDFVVKPSHFGKDYLSNGLLISVDVGFSFLPESFRRQLTLATSDLCNITKALNLSKAFHPACGQSFLLEVGFDNSFFGSQCTGTEDERPTVVGQILGAVERLGLCDGKRRMSQWVALSRVDAGVSARSFKVTTPPLAPGPGDVAKMIALEVPGSICVHRAIPIPRGVQLSPAQRILREYGFYLPRECCDISHLKGVLQSFEGDHCFANFTELKKLEGLKKKIQRDKELQTWAHQLQSWKRSRKTTDADPVSTIKVHQAMQAACRRNIQSIVVETERSAGMMCIRIKGDGFLYNMVRYLVGSALAVVTGRLSPQTLRMALESSVCVDLSEHLAPAHGLVLLDQSLNARWMLQGSEVAARSADRFFQQQVLPKVQEAWRISCQSFLRIAKDSFPEDVEASSG